MKSSRSIRAAVNLSLMIMLMIQPVVACAMGSECSVESAADVACSACGNCEAIGAQSRCACCCGGEQPAELRSRADASCCSGEPTTRNELQARRRAEKSTQAKNAVGTSVFRSICLCRLASQPLGAPAQSPAETEARHLSPLGLHFSVSNETDDEPDSRPAEPARGSGPARGHFSQVVLCVWRL